MKTFPLAVALFSLVLLAPSWAASPEKEERAARARMAAAEKAEQAAQAAKAAADKDEQAAKSKRLAAEKDELAAKGKKAAAEKDEQAAKAKRVAAETDERTAKGKKAAAETDERAAKEKRVAAERDQQAAKEKKAAAGKEDDAARKAAEKDEQVARDKKTAAEKDEQAAQVKKAAAEKEEQAVQAKKLAAEKDERVARDKTAAADKEEEEARTKKVAAEKDEQAAKARKATADKDEQSAKVQRLAAEKDEQSAKAKRTADEREYAKEVNRIRTARFYRPASTILDNVLRYAQSDDEKLPLSDRLNRVYYEGRWPEVGAMLKDLPGDAGIGTYDRMLDDMTGRTAPVLSLDDFLGFCDACPAELTDDRVRKLGLLLKLAVAKEQELWLRKALKQGTRVLGNEKDKKLLTGRILLHAGFDQLAKEYLPTVVEAAAIEDAQVRDEILNFLASREELEEFQQKRIALVWDAKAKTLANPSANDSALREAVDRMTEVLGRAPTAAIKPWLKTLLRENPEGALRLATNLGRTVAGKVNDSDIAARTNYLKAQKCFLLCAAEQADLGKAPWVHLATAMADSWMREAELSAQYDIGRPTANAKPHVAASEVLEATPETAWVKAMPANLRERVDVCVSRLVLATDRYEQAVDLIVQLAERNPKAAATVAEDYLRAWARWHDPQVPEDIRKKHALPEDARIVITPIMMERNVENLARMMKTFRERGVKLQNAEALVDAFDVCYSNAEVYRRSHIEHVFGPIDTMDDELFEQMIRKMAGGLSTRWRKVELQKESGTRRTNDETLQMVRQGYQAVIEMVEQRSKKHAQAWRPLVLAGSLLSEWADFEYYQEMVAERKAARTEAFRDKNNKADEYFARAAKAYAAEVTKLGAGSYSIDPYLAWFHSLLGINANGELNLAKPLDRRALGALREAIRSLPGAAAKAHIDCFARYVGTRMEDKQNPLHEDLKYKYLAGSLVITRESPFSFQATNKINYYDELLSELRLETRVDGSNTVDRDQHFGIVLSVQHTEAIGRMADFGKYLVNETAMPNGPVQGGRKKQQMTNHSSVLGPKGAGVVQGRRDQLELNIREALGLFFDIKSITFSPRNVQPRATERSGWQETVLAYVHVKAKDASVDKVPSVQMSLEFLDMTGPVKISAESAETMIKVSDKPTAPRPFHRADVTVVVDPRNLARSEEVLLEINATADGLAPELDNLLDLSALSAQLPIVHIDPHDGAMVRQVHSWGGAVGAASERRWTVSLDAAKLLKPPQRIQLKLPTARTEDAVVKYQTYQDMDLVDLEEASAIVGPTSSELAPEPAPGLPTWAPYAIAGGTIAIVLILALVLVRLLRGTGERPLRASDVFHMPKEIDGFVVVKLLRSLGNSPLVRLSDAQRDEIQQDMDHIQRTCFNGNGLTLAEDELRGTARKWLRTAS